MSTGRLGHSLSRLAVMRLGAMTEDSSEILRSVTSVLAFVSDVTVNATEIAEQSTLVFVSEAIPAVDRPLDVESILAFDSFLGQDFTEDVESVLAFVSDVDPDTELNRSVESAIVFAQDVQQNFKYGIASSNLGFVQTVSKTGPTYEQLAANLGFQQTVVGHLGVINQTLGSAIVFIQEAGRVITAEASNTLAFVSEGERRNTAEHVLGLVQTVSAGRAGIVSQTLAFVSAVTLEADLNRDLETGLNLVSSATYSLERSCTEKNYTPFVGSGSNEFTPPSTTVPTLGSATLTLTYPYVSPTTTLVLRNPEFRNTDTLNFNRINRVTRGGTLIVFADPDWPKTQTLRMECQYLKKEQADNLLDFFKDSLGKEIGLLDHENRQWRGIVMTPDAEISHVSRSNRSVSFDFEGELV